MSRRGEEVLRLLHVTLGDVCIGELIFRIPEGDLLAGLAEPLPGDLDDLLGVDGVHHGLAHAFVVERRRAVVEHHRVEDAVPPTPVRVGHVFDELQRERDRGGAAGVDLLRLERGWCEVRVAWVEVVPVQFVHIRLTRDVVIGVLLEDVFNAVREVIEDERTTTDRLLLGKVAGVLLLRDDLSLNVREVRDQRRVRCRGVHRHGVGVGRVHAVDELEHRPEDVVRLIRAHVVEVGLDVVGREVTPVYRSDVLPLCVLAKMEDGRLLVGLFARLGEVRLNREVAQDRVVRAHKAAEAATGNLQAGISCVAQRVVLVRAAAAEHGVERAARLGRAALDRLQVWGERDLRWRRTCEPPEPPLPPLEVGPVVPVEFLLLLLPHAPETSIAAPAAPVPMPARNRRRFNRCQ